MHDFCKTFRAHSPLSTGGRGVGVDRFTRKIPQTHAVTCKVLLHGGSKIEWQRIEISRGDAHRRSLRKSRPLTSTPISFVSTDPLPIDSKAIPSILYPFPTSPGSSAVTFEETIPGVLRSMHSIRLLLRVASLLRVYLQSALTTVV